MLRPVEKSECQGFHHKYSTFQCTSPILGVQITRVEICYDICAFFFFPPVRWCGVPPPPSPRCLARSSVFFTLFSSPATPRPLFPLSAFPPTYMHTHTHAHARRALLSHGVILGSSSRCRTRASKSPSKYVEGRSLPLVEAARCLGVRQWFGLPLRRTRGVEGTPVLDNRRHLNHESFPLLHMGWKILLTHITPPSPPPRVDFLCNGRAGISRRSPQKGYAAAKVSARKPP